MKILYVTDSTFPNHRAHSIQIINTCAAFSEQGCDITLLARRVRAISTFKPRTVPEAPGLSSAPLWPRGISEFYGVEPTFELTDPRPALPGRRMGFALSALLWIWRCERRCGARFDTIYTRSPALALLCARFRFSVILETHNVPEPDDTKSRRLFERLARHQQNQRLRVVVISETLREIMAHLGFEAERILVAHDAVDLRRFEPPLSPASARQKLRAQSSNSAQNEPKADTGEAARGDSLQGLSDDLFLVGYCGHFNAGRGLEELMQCAARRPDQHFLLIGGLEKDVAPRRGQKVREQLKNVHFAGYVNNPELGPYLMACDVLAMPYSQSKNRASFMSPMKMFEYLAAGRAIVASNWPQIREVLLADQNAILVPPGDVEALHQALCQLQQNADLRNRLANAAGREAQRHSWHTRARHILEWIQSENKDFRA